jgi:hypothetical protein
MRGLSLLAGLLLGAICVAALRIDILNNWHYGLTVSHELAGVLLLAAIGVAALPAVAGFKGWGWLYGLGTAGCVALTVMAAFLSYTAKQGEIAAARQTSADAYASARRDEADARRDEREARGEAAAISETASANELALLADEAKAKAGREEGRGGCLGKCEVAKDAHAALIGRLGQATAKAAALDRAEAARQRVVVAQGRAHGGSARLPMSATWIAAQAGWDAAEVAQSIDVGFSLLSILVTQVFALLGHPAVKLVLWGIERREPALRVNQGVVQAIVRADPAVRSRKVAIRSKRTVPPDVLEEVESWARRALVPMRGAAMPASELFDAYAASGGDLTSARLGAAMSELGCKKLKRNGKVQYVGLAFRRTELRLVEN